LEGGADNYLVAPIEADELVANVKALLRLRSAQTELRDSEERFRELAENIDDVFWVFSHANQVLYISPAYEKMWQRSMQDLLKAPDDWLNGVHEKDRERIEEIFMSVLQLHDYDEEYRILQPDGSVKWVRDRAYVVRNSDGVIYRIVRITNDISVKKNMEYALREADNNKNIFLATLAHELRNPLASIRNAVSIMQQVGVTSPEVQEKAHDVIIRQVGHLAYLVNDLLDVARISQGKIALRKTRVELRAVIQAAVEAATPFLEVREHVFDFFTPDEDVWLEADPVRLAQCIGNLLHNAAKFTPKGGRITLKAELSGNHTKISVEDNGIGIGVSKLPQVFDLFAQGEVSSDQVQEGLGIGLSLAKKLIELHDGKIGVQSPGVGLGSLFTIELPTLAPLAPLGEPARNTAAARSSKTLSENLRFLIIDDNEDSLEMMSLLLKAMGHQTLLARDAISGIDMAKKNVLDVVISDIGLPKIDGYQVARTLRSEPGFAGTRLIALTGYGTPDDQRKAEEAGFDRHFVKPVDINALLSFLNDP
jgi:PAS domain S-box-containing protein